eukprot:sb/3475648/
MIFFLPISFFSFFSHPKSTYLLDHLSGQRSDHSSRPNALTLNKASEGDDMGDVDILGSDCDSPAAASTVPSGVSITAPVPSSSSCDTSVSASTSETITESCQANALTTVLALFERKKNRVRSML